MGFIQDLDTLVKERSYCMLAKVFAQVIVCLLFFVFIFPFSGFPQRDLEGRAFEKKVLQLLRDKENIEMPVVYFMPFDWDIVRIAHYAHDSNFLRGDGFVYSLEFQDASGKILKEIVLPLRFAHSKYDRSLMYTKNPYLSKEKFGRDAKFKIKRMSSTYRDGGNELEIELK